MAVAVGEVVVAAFAAFDGGDVVGPDAEVVGDGLQGEPACEACGAQVGDVGDGGWVRDEREDLVGDVAFEAADRFAFRLALGDLLVM